MNEICAPLRKVATCEPVCVDIKKAAATAVFKTLFGFRFAENDCVNIQVLHIVFSTRSLQCSLLSRRQVGE
jgi:hypothetical protein